VRRLDDLHSLRNALATIADQQPDHPAVQRLHRPPLSVPAGEIDDLLRSAPAELSGFLEHRGGADSQAVRDWLRTNAGAIARLRESTTAHRLTFATKEADSGWMISHRPADWYPAQRLCGVFAASAVERALSGENREARSDLDAARAVGLDLADGTSTVHKEAALSCRVYAYAGVLVSLERRWSDASQVDTWANWLALDPPLPTLQDTVITEAMKAFQILEGSIQETRPGGGGHIDLRSLDGLTDGLFTKLGVFTSQSRADFESVSPVEALEALDRFGREVSARSAAGDAGPYIANAGVPLAASADAGLRLMNPLLPSLDVEFRFRAKVAAWRSAAQLACELCLFRSRHQAWPGSLQDLPDGGAKASMTGSIPGFEITYALTDDTPQLVLQTSDPPATSRADEPFQRPGARILFQPRPSE